MKHLIETIDSSSLPIVEYDRIILNSSTNDVIVGGGYKANVLMFSESGYQLSGTQGDDGQINYLTFEYDGTETYDGHEYFKYSLTDIGYILAPTRNITKVTFPFNDYHFYDYGNSNEGILPLSVTGFDSLYGFTSVPENKVVMKPRTDIGTNAHGYSYVDLGLTSGTLWATMNVGATSETDYGSYFQWGETEPHDTDITYYWEDYKYGDGSNFSKYNTGLGNFGGTIDNKVTLDLEDDAARANMGGDWRMPSLALMEELVYETNNMSATINGVNGWKFTSKTDASKYIFFPAVRNQGYTDVWSSSLYTSSPINALYLNFDSNNIGAGGYGERRIALTVRGVL